MESRFENRTPEDRAADWDSAEREQILFIARNTTPAERFRWLEQMIESMAPYLPRRDGTDPRFRPEE
jgi:hypothetical protein